MTTDQGLASELLAAEIKKKVRERGIVVWLDAERKFSPLVDALGAGAHGFGYRVFGLRGSFLELMLALEDVGSGLHPEHVLVHLPGLNKETVKETPVYELYKAGTVFEKNLGTLVREAGVGVAKPEELETFAKAEDLTLASADAWLASLREAPKDRLTELLEGMGPADVVLGLVAEEGRLRQHLPDGEAPLLAFLERTLGLSPLWRRFRFGEAPLGASKMASLIASWLMAVEFVDDLRGEPVTGELAPLKKLAAPFVKACRQLAARVREQHPDSYEELARELEDVLGGERTSHHADALGTIDTFRFEEATMRAAALAALGRGAWEVADGFARERTPASCFWVRRSDKLQSTWELIALAATTGRRFAETRQALDRAASLEHAVERYVEELAPVDRAHRLFEQRAHARLSSDLDDYDGLLEARAAVRRAHRDWADAHNRTFFRLCKLHGPLPGRALRQREIYDDIVHPLVSEGGRVAFLMVDAMRFEMAQALGAELAREKFGMRLSARLAELPTDTKVGMNALAPVSDGGRLALVLRDGGMAGFAMRSAFTVDSPASRVRAMSERSLGTATAAEDFELEEFQDMPLARLQKRLRGRTSLVVVRSRELDEAGESGLHLATFEQTLGLLRSAISLLAQAGIERFVVSSDHGFLLQDATTEEVEIGSNLRTATRRHAFLPQPSGMSEVLEVPLSALDYDAPAEGYLVFRPDTAVWKMSGGRSPFVHGGNSLQERVIPVLVLEKSGPRGRSTTRYEVVARAEPAHLGRQRLRVAVRLQSRETASLGFLAPKGIRLALRVVGRPEVTVQLLEAGPPATLVDGHVLVPPNRDEAVLEFELQANDESKARIEIYHPDAVEDVAPKTVEGFFDVGRDIRALRAKSRTAPPPAPEATPPVTAEAKAPSGWAELIEDAGYRRALEILAERRSINETELAQVLGSPRRVRAFSIHYDKLVTLLPFEVEVRTVNGMKAYVRKD